MGLGSGKSYCMGRKFPEERPQEKKRKLRSIRWTGDELLITASSMQSQIKILR